MKILYSDWVFDDQEESDECDAEGTKKENVIEEDTEFSPNESVGKTKKRGRTRKSFKEVKSVKKPKRSSAAVKTKKNVPIEVKSSSITKVGSQGNVINLDDEDEVDEFEQKLDMNENQKFSHPVTVASSSDEVKSSFEVPNSTLVNEIRSIRSFSVSDQAPGVSPLPVSPALPSPPVTAQLRPGQPRMLKPLRVGVGMISQEIVKSEQKMDANDIQISPETVTSPKLMNTSHDLTNTTPEQNIGLSSTSPHHSSSPPVSDQGDHHAPAPPNFPVKQLSQAVRPMPGPRSSPGQILVRPAQPRMLRPLDQGWGVARAVLHLDLGQVEQGVLWSYQVLDCQTPGPLSL